MYRPYVTICALVLSAGLLAACGQDKEEMANTAEDSGQEQTTQEDVTTETDTTAETDAAGGEAVEQDTIEMAEAENAPAADSGTSVGTAPEPDTDAAASGGDKAPTEVVESTEQGQLKNPYADDPESVAEEGHKIYMGLGCNGCHGGTGGGGMGPPLTNPIWVYGSDGDTLFRFVTLGSDGYQKEYNATRKGSENVVGPMPPMGGANIESADDLWKVISWIRTINPDSGGGSSSGGPKPPEFD
ncbi:MAG: c-type cytochrome [Methyloligella sp. ZOD6]